ncbi:DMT family transporter [Eleftheria terrae]|uniref:DMT family transporter n=1 Tax=Eleftheria terrae TaxID=1597781 RepID=UPI00263BE472|nr:DMT family transporter [Eleftheria terrae]WKB51790.1 DMT family transporter [Eleftheria terrae]
MSDTFKGPLLCSLAMVLVGSTVAVSKIIGQEVEPFLATVLRHALALPVFGCLLWLRRQALPRIGARDAAVLLLQAAAGSVGYTVLLIQGVAWSSAADAAVVSGTLPAVAAAFSAVWLGERPGRRLLAALALATLGVMVVAASPADGQVPPTRLLGLATVLAAVACEAVFILGNKKLAQPLPPLLMSTLMSAGGLLMAAAPAAWLWLRSPQPVLPAAAGWLGIAYYAWVPTVGGFLLWYAGSQRTSGFRAALSTAWLPVAALLLSATLPGEAVRPWQWLGLACVLAAMWLAALDQRSPSRQPPACAPRSLAGRNATQE